MFSLHTGRLTFKFGQADVNVFSRKYRRLKVKLLICFQQHSPSLVERDTTGLYCTFKGPACYSWRMLDLTCNFHLFSNLNYLLIVKGPEMTTSSKATGLETYCRPQTSKKKVYNIVPHIVRCLQKNHYYDVEMK